MKNEIDGALNYAIEQVEVSLKGKNYKSVYAICSLLKEADYSEKIRKYIQKSGRKYIEKVSEKYDLMIGNNYWFLEWCTRDSLNARLEVLKLIKNERIQRGSDTKTAD